MFGIGTTELIVILVVALIIIGPQKLPELIKNLGRGLSEVKKMSNDVKNTLDAEVSAADNERQAKDDRAKEEARRKAEVEAMDKARQAEADKVEAEKAEDKSAPVAEAAAGSDSEGGKA
ncbi:sec-independent protein translocase protein TatB [Maridesulfovibrio ferrireducens]|uniref:Sec-independent protein translocase protein TatB n=1 Tax=Maridesulfovibrio ferrireducens TaxID=246191 RepID=A0A1G9ED75_9BACT|nr:Sec-independent protein translocase protein TatB [Maridesulfovibrio ferrireducens]SDK74102.1 sec-independent protein translocase protein TatB [Maridesulfovibrio ferrireducens]